MASNGLFWHEMVFHSFLLYFIIKDNFREELLIMKIAIVDDCESERDSLAEMVTVVLLKKGIAVQKIDCFENGQDFFEQFKIGRFDILFIDIYMNQMNGIEISKKIRAIDSHVRLVLVSSSNDFASESYRVKADYYLLKPITTDQLEDALSRISTQEYQKKKILTLPGDKTILLHSILYTSYFGHYVSIHMKNGDIVKVRMTQQMFEKILQPFSEFVVCTKGMIVNLNEVFRLESNCFLLSGGETVPISRRNYSKIKKCYSDFLIEKIRKDL